MVEMNNTTPKILLLLPPSFLYPMGAAYVAATLGNAGYDYDIYGFFYDNRAWFKRNCIGTDASSKGEAVRNISIQMSQDSLFELIAREKYDYVLVGGLVGFFRWFYQILPQVKGYNPNCKIIMGGGITKDLPENTIFEKLDVNYILKGEAETNLIELLTVLSKENHDISELFKVPGLCWKDSASAIRKNATVRFDLDKTMILPAWDAFHIDEYLSLSDTLFRFNKTFFPVLAGRGCPNVCSFCSPSIGSFTPCSVDNVIFEMKHWLEKYDFDFFFIYSEIAFDDESYTQEFCRKYKKEINKPWIGQLRTDVNFSVETYRLMKEAGCMFICMGFESACDRVLKVMNKQTTFSDHMRNLSQAREAGINVFGNFMFGHEAETKEEIEETFNFINQYDLISGPSNGLATIIIYPGTSYYRNADKQGLIEDPFKFLLSYSMKAGISYVDIREKDDASRLNISALSNDAFYDVVCAENIKHRRFYSTRHTAIDVERTFALGSEACFVFSGKCPTCGSVLEFNSEAYHNPLNITKVCDECYYSVKLDIYQFPETKAFLEDIKKSIEESSKIVVYGSWIMDLLFCNNISIDFEKIIAWVDPEKPEVSSYNHFYHLPQLSLAALEKQYYNAIITLAPRAAATPQIIMRQGLNPDVRLINPIPDVLNTVIAKQIAGKRVAIAGESNSVNKVIGFLIADKNLNAPDRYSNIWDICDADVRYDFIILDKDEFGVDRHEFAQKSCYRANQILHVEFLLDGGYYAKP
jgi:radical SAM superfamily enzyme YgiQ (UPF0313 family)